MTRKTLLITANSRLINYNSKGDVIRASRYNQELPEHLKEVRRIEAFTDEGKTKWFINKKPTTVKHLTKSFIDTLG